MSSLFGKPAQSSNQSSGSSTSSSLSNNLAYPALSQAMMPQVQNATGSSNQMANMLGLNGAQGQNEGFNNWKNSTGYQFGLDQGMGAITGGAASKGLLNSGSTAKALGKFGMDYASTKYGDYMNQLMGLGNQGNSAAGIIGNTGQQSQSQSQSVQQSSGKEMGAKDGIGKMLGSIFTKGAM